MRDWRSKTELAKSFFIARLGVCTSKFRSWEEWYGKDNEHNGNVPRDHWLLPEEKERIISYYLQHQQDGYRSITYQLMDQDIVVCSPSTTYRVLRNAGFLKRWVKSSKKGKGFVQPLEPHEHWHTDIAYLNIAGTFYYFSAVLDGCSRYIVHWDIKESMKEEDVEILLQEAIERTPGVTPRLISDNGPCYIANDFKSFLRSVGMTHVRTKIRVRSKTVGDVTGDR